MIHATLPFSSSDHITAAYIRRNNLAHALHSAEGGSPPCRHCRPRRPPPLLTAPRCVTARPGGDPAAAEPGEAGGRSDPAGPATSGPAIHRYKRAVRRGAMVLSARRRRRSDEYWRLSVYPPPPPPIRHLIRHLRIPQADPTPGSPRLALGAPVFVSAQSVTPTAACGES